jgi:hypothetical protein
MTLMVLGFVARASSARSVIDVILDGLSVVGWTSWPVLSLVVVDFFYRFL